MDLRHKIINHVCFRPNRRVEASKTWRRLITEKMRFCEFAMELQMRGPSLSPNKLRSSHSPQYRQRTHGRRGLGSALFAAGRQAGRVRNRALHALSGVSQDLAASSSDACRAVRAAGVAGEVWSVDMVKGCCRYRCHRRPQMFRYQAETRSNETSQARTRWRPVVANGNFIASHRPVRPSSVWAFPCY